MLQNSWKKYIFVRNIEFLRRTGHDGTERCKRRGTGAPRQTEKERDKHGVQQVPLAY